MAKLGLEPRSRRPGLALLPRALGGSVSRDSGRSQDQTRAVASGSEDKDLTVPSTKAGGTCLAGLKRCLAAACGRPVLSV